MRTLLRSLNWDGTLGLWLLAGCLLLVLPEAGGESARMLLRYERAALGAGEGWRWLTAHIVHLDLEHAVLNALGLVLMWALFARDYRPRHWLWIAAGSVAAIDAGLWLRDSTVEWYVGSSGALHGMMAAGTLAHLRRGDLDGWILTMFLVAKLAWEQWTGALPFAQGAAPVIVNVHLYGAIGGALVAATLKRRTDPV